MPLFGRKPKPLPPPSAELPSGEEVERAVRATLLYGKQQMKGVLHMTNRRLMFEAAKGNAKWMIVPYTDIRSAGLYPWPGAAMGRPSSQQQCLVVETSAGEQVWWDFNEKDERDWLPLVRARIPAGEESEE
jgi:hypothetical protein